MAERILSLGFMLFDRVATTKTPRVASCPTDTVSAAAGTAASTLEAVNQVRRFSKISTNCPYFRAYRLARSTFSYLHCSNYTNW